MPELKGPCFYECRRAHTKGYLVCMYHVCIAVVCGVGVPLLMKAFGWL